MNKEIWKPIPGYEGCYEISTYGQIKSLDRYVTFNSRVSHDGQITVPKHGKIISQRYLSKGRRYLLATLFNADSVRKDCQVHRLVAITFIPNPDNLPCVNHKDENPENNHVNNLEWCTVRYNANYGTRNQRLAEAQLVAQPSSRRVAQINIDGSIYRVFYSQKAVARYYNISAASVSRVCLGKIKHTHGMYFKYITDKEYKRFQHLNNCNKGKNIQIKCHRNGRLVC